jgi:hypothetical protein
MKYFALLGLLTAFVLFPIAASADWSDNFDSYALGSGLHGQGGWEGWLGDAGATAYITNVQSHSSPQSVNITGASDMVHPYTGYTTGQWTYTAWQYVPTDFSGISYFLLLNQYQGTQNWSCQVEFDGGTGLVISDFDGATLTLIRGRWVELRVEIDLGTDNQTFYYDNQMLYSKSWTEGLSGGGILNIACVDLYANNASPVYYDDMSLTGTAPTAVCCVGQNCYVVTEQECTEMQGVFHPEWDSCGPPNPCAPSPVEPTSWGSVKSLFR